MKVIYNWIPQIMKQTLFCFYFIFLQVVNLLETHSSEKFFLLSSCNLCEEICGKTYQQLTFRIIHCMKNLMQFWQLFCNISTTLKAPEDGRNGSQSVNLRPY